MSGSSVRERYPDSVAAIMRFFAQFYGSDLAQTDDEEAEVVLFHVGRTKKLVVVSSDFLAGFTPEEIRENLAAWNVAHLSRTLERGCRLLVTSEGPEEQRD